MNGRKAKLLRDIVYGEETHRQRSYFRIRGKSSIVSDKKRRIYKHIKRIYTRIRGLSPTQLEILSSELKAQEE